MESKLNKSLQFILAIVFCMFVSQDYPRAISTTFLTIGSCPRINLSGSSLNRKAAVYSQDSLATLKAASAYNIFNMQDENLNSAEQLSRAVRIIKYQKILIETLQENLNTEREAAERYRETISYLNPKLEIGFDPERVYLPVYGDIDSPPFSKS